MKVRGTTAGTPFGAKLTSKAEAYRHLIDVYETRGQTFMPAERMTAGEKQWTASNTQFEGGMGIDATVPFGYESDFLRPVYPVDRVKPEDFFSKKDIENARSRMVGWVHSLARTGR